MNGVLAVLKPPGPSSHEVVARVRGLARCRRIGHAGTLDPAAAGVLPLCLGVATRLADYLHIPAKTYRFVLVLGETTPTLDQMSAVDARVSAAHLRAPDLEGVLRGFCGVIRQRVPVYSARRKDGVRLYAYARAGAAVEQPVATCTIHRVQLLEWRGGPVAHACCEVTCSAGTYVRALCADMGAALGVGGHLGALLRTRAGGIGAAECVSLEEVVAGAASGDLGTRLLPPERALGFLPALVVDGPEARGVRYGRPPGRRVPPAGAPNGEECVRLLDAEGRLLAVARRRRRPGEEIYALERVLVGPGERA